MWGTLPPRTPTTTGAALPCVCGGAGHVEAIASGPAIHAAFLRLGGSAEVPDTRAVFALAHDGDAAAAAAITDGAPALPVRQSAA